MRSGPSGPPGYPHSARSYPHLGITRPLAAERRGVPGCGNAKAAVPFAGESAAGLKRLRRKLAAFAPRACRGAMAHRGETAHRAHQAFGVLCRLPADGQKQRFELHLRNVFSVRIFDQGLLLSRRSERLIRRRPDAAAEPCIVPQSGERSPARNKFPKKRRGLQSATRVRV